MGFKSSALTAKIIFSPFIIKTKPEIKAKAKIMTEKVHCKKIKTLMKKV